MSVRGYPLISSYGHLIYLEFNYRLVRLIFKSAQSKSSLVTILAMEVKVTGFLNAAPAAQANTVPSDTSLTSAAPCASGLPLRKANRKQGEILADLESELFVTNIYDTTSWKTKRQSQHQNKTAYCKYQQATN